MTTRKFVLGSALLMPLLSVSPTQAQRVRADIIIGGGPVAGRVIIGDQNRYHGRPRSIERMEWVRARDYRRDDWFRRFQRESRVVVVYYDRDDDCYYFDRFRPDLEEIEAYERDGRYYRLEDDGYGARYDDRAYGRYDDRYNDGSYSGSYGRYDDRYVGRHRDNRRDKHKGDKDHRRHDRQDHRWDDDDDHDH